MYKRNNLIMSKKFVIDKEGKIYAYNAEKDYYLLRTPWEYGEDRRKPLSDLVEPRNINSNDANRKINEAWRNHKAKWEYNGKKFETRGTVYDEKVTERKSWEYDGKTHYYYETNYTNLFKLCPVHKFEHTYKTKNGEKKSYYHEYYIVWYQGKLVWAMPSQYIPRVQYYDFESADKEPMGFNRWTSINNIKPIYCITDKKFI